ANALRAALRDHARLAGAAVGVDRALAARSNADVLAADVGRHPARDGVRNAGHAVAAVRARGAGFARGRAFHRRATRDADAVGFARVLVLAIAATAIARGIARHRRELADVPVGLAAHRVPAHAELRAWSDIARDRFAGAAGEALRSA